MDCSHCGCGLKASYVRLWGVYYCSTCYESWRRDLEVGPEVGGFRALVGAHGENIPTRRHQCAGDYATGAGEGPRSLAAPLSALPTFGAPGFIDPDMMEGI